MAIITISRGTFSGAKELAEALAQRLGYRCLSREDLTAEATNFGIPVEKLRSAVLKPPRARETLGYIRDVYRAFMQYRMCDYLLEDNIVYHGHTGHLLIPGVPNILRIRAIAEQEYRIRAVEQQLHLEREKVKSYIEKIDAERNRWVQFMYNIKWDDPIHYDLIVNLSGIGAAQLIDAITVMALSREFQFTPAAMRSIENLRLASYARVLLGMNEKTADADVRITASHGFINVTYSPQQARYAPYVYDILSNMEGCKEVTTTIAKTSILWIQERFEPETEILPLVLDIAKKWDAAIDMMRWHATESACAEWKCPVDSETRQETAGNGEHPRTWENSSWKTYDPCTSEVRERLMTEGQGGGCITVYGGEQDIREAIRDPREYCLILIHNVFLSKAEATRRRLLNLTKAALSDLFQVPVVEPDELKQKGKFGLLDQIVFIGRFCLSAVLFLGVFLYQEQVLRFFTDKSDLESRIIAMVTLLLFVPLFAYLYGSTTRTILKLFKID